MSEHDKLSTIYDRDRTTPVECFDEDGITPLFEDGKRVTTNNRDLSAYILENVIGGSQFGRDEEDAEWLRAMFNGFEDHIANLQSALAGIEFERPEDVRAVILAAHTLCKYPCQEADDALVRALSKIKIEE